MIDLKKLNRQLNEKIESAIEDIIDEESSRLQKTLSGKKFKIRVFDTLKNTSNYLPASLVTIWCSASFGYSDEIEYRFSAEYSYKNPKNGQMQIEAIDDLEIAFVHGKIKIENE